MIHFTKWYLSHIRTYNCFGDSLKKLKQEMHWTSYSILKILLEAILSFRVLLEYLITGTAISLK